VSFWNFVFQFYLHTRRDRDARGCSLHCTRSLRRYRSSERFDKVELGRESTDKILPAFHGERLANAVRDASISRDRVDVTLHNEEYSCSDLSEHVESRRSAFRGVRHSAGRCSCEEISTVRVKKKHSLTRLPLRLDEK